MWRNWYRTLVYSESAEPSGLLDIAFDITRKRRAYINNWSIFFLLFFNGGYRLVWHFIFVAFRVLYAYPIQPPLSLFSKEFMSFWWLCKQVTFFSPFYRKFFQKIYAGRVSSFYKAKFKSGIFKYFFQKGENGLVSLHSHQKGTANMNPRKIFQNIFSKKGKNKLLTYIGFRRVEIKPFGIGGAADAERNDCTGR